MTTSSTNTLLTELAIKWCALKAGLTEEEIKALVEGDDSMSGVAIEARKKVLLLRDYMSTLGFDTTCDMEGFISDTPNFCKI